MMHYTGFIKLILIGSFLFLNKIIIAQEKINFQGEHFKEQKIVYKKNDTISYLVNVESFDINKPTIVWLMGSLPTPLAIELEMDSSYHITPIGNFDNRKLLAQFNVILVSRPFTPVLCKQSELNSRFCYVPDLNKPDCFDLDFQRTNNLYYLSNRISFLVDHLISKRLITKKNFLLLGHSQGGRVAGRVAKLNSKVCDVAILSESPIGRLQYYLLSNHFNYQTGKIGYDEYEEVREQLLNDYKDVFNYRNSVSCQGDSKLNWISFSEPLLNDLVKTKANVYYGIGSMDLPSLLSELISVECIKENKQNIEVKLYDKCEHNFFEVDENGVVDYQKGSHWGIVINDIIEWYFHNRK